MITGAVAGAFAVALGAFGAHALKDVLNPERLQVYETAIRYLGLHAIILVVTGWINHERNEKLLTYSALGFVLGMILFSGSLLILALAGIRTMGAVAPVGGLFLVAAWLLLGWGCFRSVR